MVCCMQDANAQWQCYGFKAGEDQAWCRSVGVDGCTEYKVPTVNMEPLMKGWVEKSVETKGMTTCFGWLHP